MGIVSMKINVTILPEKSTQKIEVKSGSKVTDLLQKMQLKPDTLIVLTNNLPIPVDDELHDNQEIQIIKVASGG